MTLEVIDKKPGIGNYSGPTFRWKSGYKVTVLAKPKRCLDLPGKKATIDQDQVLENRNTLVCGEGGGGHSNFLRWWVASLNSIDPDYDWILVDATSWNQPFFRKSSNPARKGKGGASDKAAEAIERLGQEQGVVNRTQALHDWAQDLKRPFTLIICNLMALGLKQALEVATALRRLRDPDLCPQLHVVVSSASESIFADQMDRSGYRSLCEEYRLPSLDGEDVTELAASSALGWSPVSFEKEALKTFIKHTGGQPLLVQHLLVRLGEIVKSGERIVTVVQIDEAARQMRYSPPERARYWQEDLQRILKAAPELVPAMKSYVAGASLGRARFPPPAEERALFIAGWVRLDEMDRWGITSLFHAHLARPVLQGLRRDG